MVHNIFIMEMYATTQLNLREIDVRDIQRSHFGGPLVDTISDYLHIIGMLLFGGLGNEVNQISTIFSLKDDYYITMWKKGGMHYPLYWPEEEKSYYYNNDRVLCT